MTLDDFPELPNGLHDAFLLGISIDVDRAEARFEVDAWVGGGPEGAKEAREARLRCAVIVSGLSFFSVDPADPRYADAPKPGMIDVGDGKASGSPVETPKLPPGTSLSWLYVGSRNSFIHVAGTAVRLELPSATPK
jgi:hypothetical protein